jgi:glutamate synthase (NADPH/NADH) small chain
LEAEGVEFQTNVHVGVSLRGDELLRDYDAVLICAGAEQPRDLAVPGRNLKGVHFAMDFLPQQNRRGAGDPVPNQILATGKRVVIIGGGDTGADCLGTSHRQKAASVHQFEIQAMPPPERAPQTPWPLWPLQLRIESSHEEGGQRQWSIATAEFSGDEAGNVQKLHAKRLDNSESMTLDVDLVLLAMGFTGPVKSGIVDQLGVELDQRGNVATGADYMSSVPGVFAAGDARRGQSLVVWAIAEGRNAAAGIDRYLSESKPA